MPDINHNRIQYLFHLYISNNITGEEYAELWKLLRVETLEKSLSKDLQWLWEEVKNKQPIISAEKWNQQIEARIEEGKEEENTGKKRAIHILKIRQLGWAAAIIAIFITSIVFFLRYNKHHSEELITASRLSNFSKPEKDIQPGGNKATLTLSNGTTIVLDSAHAGIITRQGNAGIYQSGSGSIAYQASANHSQEVVYNTLTTPRGGQFKITLPDGTKAWLNSASSLHYPTSFIGGRREVQMTGEVYFEVAKDALKPFIVSVDGMKINVLGTSFNLMAYDDVSEIKATLLTGAISVTQSGVNKILKPGEQAQVNNEGKISIVKNADLNQVVAWKNNLFWFEDNTIQEVMREVARWYDVNVVIKGNIPQHFTGSVPRDVPVSHVFEVLEETGHIQFEIRNNQIIVSP